MRPENALDLGVIEKWRKSKVKEGSLALSRRISLLKTTNLQDDSGHLARKKPLEASAS